MSEWRLIETAPENTPVVCYWTVAGDGYEPERYAFDYLEDGVWQNHCNEYEHLKIAGGSYGLSEKAPYTHWMLLPAPPKDAS